MAIARSMEVSFTLEAEQAEGGGTPAKITGRACTGDKPGTGYCDVFVISASGGIRLNKKLLGEYIKELQALEKEI